MEKRVLKFKFWDTTDHRFVDLCCIDASGRVREGNDIYDDVIPIQFTGVRDKNGKEIYEGDILKYPSNYGMALDILVPVEWISENDNHDWTGWNIGETEHLRRGEVVGNIFENPELLK